MHEVPQHAVRRQRLRVGGEAGCPLCQPLALEVLDLLGDDREAAARPALEPVLHLDQQRLEREAGVANQRQLHGHVLVDVRRVERRVRDALALRHRDAVVRRREAAADSED